MRDCGKICFAVAIAAGVFLRAGAATRVVHEADFLSGVGTNGWTISADEWRSPVWPEGVVVNVCASNLSHGAALQIAEDAGRIVISRTTGAAALQSVRAEWYVTQLPAPESVSVTNVTASSFRADWASVEGAVGYRVDLYSNVVENASAGTAAFSETFAYLPAKGNATELSAVELCGYSDARLDYAVDHLFYGVNLPGVVQIGSTSAPGILGVPIPVSLVGASGRTLRFSAWRYERSNESMPIALVRAGTTSEIARVTLTTCTNTFHVALPVFANGDELLFCSPQAASGSGGEYRAALDSFAVLAGYDPGTSVKRLYRQVETSANACTLTDLASVASWIAVTARAEDAADDSAASAFVAVPLDDPPLMPILNACPLSEGACRYEPSFAALEQVTKNGTPLYNGVWPLAYWMAYDRSGNVLDKIGKGAATTSQGGAFVFLSSDESVAAAEGHALGLRAKNDCGYFYGLAFVNDLSCSCGSFAVSYDAVQWNFKNAVPATNRLEWLVTNELVDVSASGAWRQLDACDYVAEPTNALPLAEGADCRVAARAGAWPDDVKLMPGEYLLLRFAVDAMSSAPGFGWANFRLTWKKPQAGGVLLLR